MGVLNRESEEMKVQYQSLSEYLGMVQGLVEEAEGFPGWVVCELAKVSWSRGHCYLEMVESGHGGNTLAKARGTIWASRAAVLTSVFRSGTGDELRDGIKVMLYVQVQFSPVYGLSLNVLDINPSFTLGDLEAQKRATWARLEKEELTQRNKELEVPMLPYRIAVVSAQSAAGYGDFMKHLKDSGVRFEVELFEASMQGADAPSSIADAFFRINCRSAEFDVAVLIRGGGSNLDLVCFDDYLAAKAVALCNLPVISGIGHERDNHLCDDVASVRVKTPTGAADFLIQRFADAYDSVVSLEQRLEDAFYGLMEENNSLLDRFSIRLSAALNRFSQTRSGRLKDLKHRMKEALSVRILGQIHNLDVGSRRIAEAAKLKSLRQESWLSDVQRRLEGADPTRILGKGYGIILRDGQKISDVDQIEEGSVITVVMRDGKVTFTASGVRTEKKEEQ